MITAATGMSRTSAARSRSLTTITSFWSQRSTKRAGDRPEEQVGQGRGEEDEADGDRRVGRLEDEERERDLVDAVAEQADELARPRGPRTSR